MKNKHIPFTGSGCAIITPFVSGEVDYDTLGVLIERQISNGTAALAVCSTTGEGATLTVDEYKKIISYATAKSNKRVPIIAGVGSASTKKAEELAYEAGLSGADYAMVVTPYYNKATDRGIVEHYKKIAHVGLPIIIYNVPGRTGVNLSDYVYYTLAENEEFVAVKEASGDVSRCVWLVSKLGDRYALYSGTDELNYPLLSIGFDGFISVTANAEPQKLSEMYNYTSVGKWEEAKKCYFDLYDFTEKMFEHVNPIPIKKELSNRGLCRNELRLPLISEDV